jgi:hypothetical protein
MKGIYHRPAIVLVAFAALIVAVHFGCTPEPEEVRLVPNQPPETVVTGAPADSSNAFHRYQMFWQGFDPDGTIAEYWVAVTDSNIAPALRDYRRTLRTDSIIEFTANNEVVLSHAFWVYAVDNEGDRDESPARAFFNAIDVNRPVPVIVDAETFVPGQGWVPLRIQTPTQTAQDTIASEGSMVRVSWTASDADVGGSITGYRIKLSTDSQFREIPADSTSATFTDMPSGDYEFLVEAIDNAGAESLDPASLRWVVNREPDTIVRQMYVWNRHAGFSEISDFRDNPPTIRDSSRVTFFYEGNDQDGTVVDYAYRRIRCDIVRLSCQSRPFGSFFPDPFVSLPEPSSGTSDTTTLYYTSNDYFIVIRSRDNEGKADGTPDSVFFHVNYAPIMDASGVFPADGEIVNGTGIDSLDVRFRATDIETPPTELAYRVVLDGVYGGLVSGVQQEDELFDRWALPAAGTHEILYYVEDPGRRRDTLAVTFEIVMQ